MITVPKARKILGNSSSKFSDEQVERLIEQFYLIANIVTAAVGSKNQNMGLESDPRKKDYEGN